MMHHALYQLPLLQMRACLPITGTQCSATSQSVQSTLSHLIMARASKPKKSAALCRRVAKKVRATTNCPSTKASNHGGKKKSQQSAKSSAALPPCPRTPDTKQTKRCKSLPSTSTPSTVGSKSTTSSKRAVSMMNGLALKTPPKKPKRKQHVAPTTDSLCDTIDFDNAAMIDWTSIEGVRAALAHHFPDDGDFVGLDFTDQVKLLCSKFTPSDIRPVLQGILVDAGNDWRSLKLAKLKSMKQLAPELANACVDIANAKSALSASARRVPRNIVVKQERVDMAQR